MTDAVETCDVVVLGSGAAGLSAALTAHHLGAEVMVFEKVSKVGGTTAVSGGVSWIPAHGRAGGPAQNSIEDAFAYLHSFSELRLDLDLIDTFVRSGESTLDFLEKVTPIRFSINEGYPDYKPERPGGRPHGGRSFDPSPLDFSELGDWSSRVYAFPPDWSDVGFDAETLARMRGKSAPPLESTADIKFMGQALIGGLLKPLIDNGVVIRTAARARDLIVDGGRVIGVRIDAGDRRYDVRARRGVVLATGGFEWDPALVAAFLRGPMGAPVSPPGRTGDGLRMAMAAGADLANMSEAWWSTTVRIPGDTIEGQVRSRSIRSERTRPGCIMVNGSGARFANEAQDYNALGGVFHQLDPDTLTYPNAKSWMIFDERHFQGYGFLGIHPGEQPPEWFHGSPDLETLATATGIDTAGLRSTIERWNTHVTDTMSDPEFHRGASAYDGFWGDATKPDGAARTLGTIDQPPFYAVPIFVGTIGTKGGPRTTRDAQVLGVDGEVIQGLYAAGNVMASAMGGAYPGAGATIGPALVFGHRAGHHAATGESAGHG